MIQVFAKAFPLVFHTSIPWHSSHMERQGKHNIYNSVHMYSVEQSGDYDKK